MRPDDERARIREVDRAVQARALLDSPLWDEAYTTLIAAELERLLASGTSDEATLACKRRILALNEVKEHLAEIIQTGQLAEMQLQEARDG